MFCKIFGNKLLSYVGRISYPVYLIHWFLIPLFEENKALEKFLIVYILSIGIAIIIHALIEKPTTLFAKNLCVKELVAYYKNL